MSTFYLLPARPRFGRLFAELLSGLFPGTAWPQDDWHDLAEALAAAAMSQHEVYVVFAEELPADEGIEDGLRLAFGAEPGDEVVDVRPGQTLADVAVKRWRINKAMVA